MKKHTLKRSQSIFEYICVTIVFASVGIAGFVLANQAAASRLRGEASTYKSTETAMGKTLDDGLSKDQYKWPETWGQPQADSTGVVPANLVDKDNPDSTGLVVPKEEE